MKNEWTKFRNNRNYITNNKCNNIYKLKRSLIQGAIKPIKKYTLTNCNQTDLYEAQKKIGTIYSINYFKLTLIQSNLLFNLFNTILKILKFEL